MIYNPIKRIRSWFFNQNIPTEPRQYRDAQGNLVTVQVKTRLGKDHVTKEETLQDLLHSIFFKSSGADLQDIATTNDVQSALDVEKIVKPNQLPELTNSNQETIGDFTNTVFTASPLNLSGKKGWYYNFTTSFKQWLLSRLIPSGGNAGQVLKKVSNTSYDVSWQTDNVGSSVPPFVVGDANKYLQINPTGTALEWDTVDAPTVAQFNLLQGEVDAIETGAGLNANGTYTPPVGTNYIDGATSLKNADVLLDTAIGNLTTIGGLVSVFYSFPFGGGNISFNLEYRVIGKNVFYKAFGGFSGVTYNTLVPVVASVSASLPPAIIANGEGVLLTLSGKTGIIKLEAAGTTLDIGVAGLNFVAEQGTFAFSGCYPTT